MARWASVILAVALLGAPIQAIALSITPTSLTFEARLDDPTLLTVEVDLGPDSTSKLDADITGFDCDRRITALGAGKYKVEIAPDTIKTGNVKGQLELRADGKSLGQPVPITGSIRPWIRTTPSRIFLGSVGKGASFTTPRTFQVTLTSDTEPFDVTSVELPEIAGASWKCDPPVGEPAFKKTLLLTFSPDALTEGLPFGALAIKYLAIETTHPRAQSLSIPIQGLISVNTTGRDYSQYLYKGNLRWQGPWGTPNMAAAFLAAAIILVCGIGAALHNRLKTYPCSRIVVGLVFFTSISTACYFLVQTYSRGGWFAAAAGTIVLGIGARGARIYPITLAAIFATFVFFNPHGIDRAASTSLITEDKSISHRLLLWQGALQMMMEHPWTGVGKGKFGEIFRRSYQLPDHKENYSTAINDFLTVGAENGTLALILSVSTFLTLTIVGLQIGKRHHNVLIVACAATISTLFVASWFSSVAFQCSSSLLLLFSAGAIIGIIANIFRVHLSSIGKELRQLARTWCLTTASSGMLVMLSGFIALSSRPQVRLIEISGLSGVSVSPRWSAKKGTVLYIGDRREPPDKLLQNTLRPLARKGWEVFCFEISKFTSDANLSLRSLRKLNIDVIAGDGIGAELALSTVSSLKSDAVACYMIPAQSSFTDLSPQILLPKTISRLLLCSKRDAISDGGFYKLKQICVDSRRRVTLRTFPATLPISEDNWHLWIESIDAFSSQVRE
jgi:O-antigen ligase